MRSTIAHLRETGSHGLSLNFAAMRSILEGESGDGVGQRVQRWALKRLSGVLQIETLWRFNAKYEPSWLPCYIVFDSVEQFVPVAVQIMRAESLTEVPVIGRLLTTSAAKRSGAGVAAEALAPREPTNGVGCPRARGVRRPPGDRDRRPDGEEAGDEPGHDGERA